MSYAELDHRSDMVAAALGAAGLRPGDRAAIQTPNRVEFVELIVGLIKAGVVLVPVSYLDGPEQVTHIVHDSAAKLFFHDPSLAETVAAARGSIDADIFSFDGPDADTASTYSQFLENGAAGVAVSHDAEHPLYIGYTSGSTGRPKGVVKSEGSVVDLAFAVSVEWGLRPGAVQLLTMPMCHSGALWQVMFDLVLGGTIALTPTTTFDPAVVLDLLERWDVGWTVLVPTMSDLLIAEGGRSRRHCSSLHTVVSGSAPMYTATKEGLLDLFPNAELNECYGATETGVVTNLGHADQLRKVRSVGRPIVGVEAKIVDAEGQSVPPGEIGELVSRSPFNFDCYFGLPELTQRARRPDGFVGVGDLAMRDDEGHVYIVDRKDDMIISGGLNVYPAEIEEVLKSHPDVLDAIVVGMPDDKWGERVTAAVVGRTHLAAAALSDLCRRRLPAYKVPKVVVVVDSLPKLVSGKNARRLVRDFLEHEGASR